MSFLWEVGGESAMAVDDFQNAANLAIDEINAAGGIDGRTVETTRVAASPIDPQQTAGAIRQAADADPAVMVGLIVSSQAMAAAKQIDQEGKPIVVVAQPDPQLIYGAPGSTEWMWTAQPYLPNVLDALVQYLVKDKGYQKIGLMGTNESFGQTGVSSAKAAMQKLGLTPVAERLYAPDATDLSEQVLAMKGAETVINWGYPNPLALQLKQFLQNGLNIPTYDGPSAPIVATNKLAPPEALARLSAAMPCDPGDPADRPQLKSMVDAYKARYGAQPTYSAVSAYDAVKVAAKAIDEAGSTDPKAINDALGKVKVDGACGEYRADAAHVLLHRVGITDFKADGGSKVAKVIQLPDTPKGS